MSAILTKKSEYLRVTEVLAPFAGLSNVPPDILRNAQERGAKVHEICDGLVQSIGFFNDQKELDGYIDSFKIWMQDKNFENKPERFYCDKHMITGEIDGLYKNESGYTLFDIKTSAKESKTWSAQGSAYTYLARKEGFNITKIEFIKLSKKGLEPEVFEYEFDFELFLKCLELYKHFYKN